MQADWMAVGLRIAMAPSESTSHLSIPSSAKPAMVNVVFLREVEMRRRRAREWGIREPLKFRDLARLIVIGNE